MSETKTEYTVPVWVLLDLASICESGATNILIRGNVRRLAGNATDEWLRENPARFMDALNEMGQYITEFPEWRDDYESLDYTLSPPAIMTTEPQPTPTPTPAAVDVDALVQALVQALEYYANPKLYVAAVKQYHDGHYDLDCELLYEGGKRAAAALAAAQAET